MLSKIVKIATTFFQSEDQATEMPTPQNISVVFALTYQKLLIGKLSLENGVWTFAYSEEFKNQHIIKPIIGFPDTNSIYQATSLFPFFAARIPSLQRLKIQNVISNNTPTDEVSLLKRFGKQTITNPYLLVGV
jgi:HipA-like protein